MRPGRSLLLLVAALVLESAIADAEIKRSVAEDLVRLRSGKPLERSIPDASVRVAVFTYEDPDATGLGDSLAALVGRQVLLGTRVASIGVIRYEGRLAGGPRDPLSYFEKVDALTAAQGVTLAVWGAVRKDTGGLVIDTFAQLPAATVRQSFEWILQLPRGTGTLVARLRPDRLLVQRTKMPAEAAGVIQEAARALDEFRREPADSSPLVAAPPRNAVYWFEGLTGEWAHVGYEAGQGWVRFAGHCTGPCAPLLDGASFVSKLLLYDEKRIPPAVDARLAPDAAIAAAQIVALEEISRSPQDAKKVLEPWQARMKEGEALPGGAALANINAFVDVAIELRRQGGRYDDRALDPSRARAIAFDLAEASQIDPRNRDVLENLAVLFRIAGDPERAKLAGSLAQDAGSN